MGTCSFLATTLDEEMFHRTVPLFSTSIASATTSVSDPSYSKNGWQVTYELGGRYLLRYLLGHQTNKFLNGSNQTHWVTPTPYRAQATISWLALPKPKRPRNFVLLLDPQEIEKIWGPRWVRFGHGIEYILPDGFPADAVVAGWPKEVR